MNRGEIQSAQLASLRDLIAACDTNAFYAPRLRAAGLDSSVDAIASFTARMPLTTKDEFVTDQLDHPPYGTNLSEPTERYVRLHQTSSTSGRRPLRWLDTAESWSGMIDTWAEVFRAAGVTTRDRVFFAFGFGPFIGFWMGFESAQRLGALTIAGGGMSTTQRLRVIAEHGATTVCATPTYIMRLGEVAQQEGVDTTGVRALIVGGEPGGSLPHVRARLTELWPTASAFDHYGMTEVGPVTYQCTARDDSVHAHEPAYLVEVIDRASLASLPLESGVEGELVLTTLRRTASPALRYRTGDLVRIDGTDACPCGRASVRFAGGISGRVDDMVVVRGVNIYPAALDEVVRGVDGVAEYRVHVDDSAAMTEVRVTLEPAEGRDGAALAGQLEQSFRTQWNLRIPVTLTEPGSLPRFELKARRWERRSRAEAVT